MGDAVTGQRSAKTHTPGPWALCYDTRPRMEWNITVVRENDRNYAVCFMTSDGPSEANARLITAAPDLLAALKGVLRVADRATDEFDAARAAIAKAEGK